MRPSEIFNTKTIRKFLMEKLQNNEIYNEFSLQHEFGIFLRENLKNYKIEFERPINYFIENYNKSNFNKKEIDISIYNKNEKYAVELKYPAHSEYIKRGKKSSCAGYPNEMKEFVRDINFMKEAKKNNFDKTFCIVLVDDESFYKYPKKSSKKNNLMHIFSNFRGSNVLNGIIKPINNIYNIEWYEFEIGNNKYSFYLLKL